MIIIRLSGGLGNQMFEYALYLSLRARGKEVKIDDTSDYRTEGRRPVQLWVFDAEYERASEEEIVGIYRLFHEALRQDQTEADGRKSLAYREKSMEFDPLVFEKDPAYLEGYFQSEAYFAGIKDEVRKAFTFRSLSLPEGYPAYEKQIRSSMSVSVHIRRGDYLDASHNGIYEGICSCSYYEEAMEKIRKKYPDAVFFLFTNDPEWTREHLAGKDRIVVEGGSEDTGYLDLYLMSRCRHHIIANSSFSWWGAWLTDNPDKMVIAPSVWLNGQECKSIYTEDMIRI